MRLRELREEKGISQAELARAISSDTRSISRWELGQNAPTLPFVIALAKFFNCSLDFLAELVDENDRPVPQDLSDDERKLLACFRGIDKTQQRAILRTAESLYSESKDNSKIVS